MSVFRFRGPDVPDLKQTESGYRLEGDGFTFQLTVNDTDHSWAMTFYGPPDAESIIPHSAFEAMVLLAASAMIVGAEDE